MPEPVAILAVKLASGVSVNVAVLSILTVCAKFGVMLPPAVVLGVTVKVIGTQFADPSTKVVVLEGQAVCVVDPVTGTKKPSAARVQEAAPVVAAKLPAAQGVCEDAPATETKLPAVAGVCVVAPVTGT